LYYFKSLKISIILELLTSDINNIPQIFIDSFFLFYVDKSSFLC